MEEFNHASYLGKIDGKLPYADQHMHALLTLNILVQYIIYSYLGCKPVSKKTRKNLLN